MLDLVAAEMASPDRNAVVLFGQRRIGKTSILLQLKRRLQRPLLPVYFDLMDRAHKPLGQVLYEWAATIAREVRLPAPARDAFDDEGVYFRGEFLPALYGACKDGERPVLLLDEFDVLDVATEGDLSPKVAARAFRPFLRQLMEGEPRLGFVFVVGRKAEELSIDVKATFKAAKGKKVSVLDEHSAAELVRSAEKQGSLRFAPGAIERILALTSGHPYLTQLMCQLLWDSTHAASGEAAPVVDEAAVDAIVPKVLEAGDNIFEWIWVGLPPAERVIFAAIAAAIGEGGLVSEQELIDILQRHGVRILTSELEHAPAVLVDWQMLREVQGNYGFFVELLRRWIADRKPMAKVKDDLDRNEPRSDRLFRVAEDYYRDGDLENAKDQIQKALRTNPNHLKARLRLGQILQDEGKLAEAVKELEEAYKYDDDAARHPLIRGLLLLGEERERQGMDPSTALEVYERVLEISPEEKITQERRTALLRRIDEQARKVKQEPVKPAPSNRLIVGVVAGVLGGVLLAQVPRAFVSTAGPVRPDLGFAPVIDMYAHSPQPNPEDCPTPAICYEFARMYDKGEVVQRDFKRAARLYKKACDGGDLSSCNRLGTMYKDGNGVAKDYTRAVDLYKKACDGGNAFGCEDLGKMYRDGKGVTRDEAAALKLFKKVCDGGSAFGCEDLGKMYRDGKGVARDEAAALKLFKKVCDGGSAFGCEDLGEMYRDGKGVTRDEAAALKLFKKACDSGSALCCKDLGEMYRDGKGVTRDEAAALKLFKKACDSGYENACTEYQRLGGK